MIADCRKAGLPEPDFEQRGPHFVVTIWRDWLTAEVMAGLELTPRQQQVITYLKENRTISNTIYQEAFGVSKRSASRELNALVDKALIVKTGTTGKGVFYRLRKGAI